MVDAISGNRIDVIINWSLCYESFSFTTMEAISAGRLLSLVKARTCLATYILDPGKPRACP